MRGVTAAAVVIAAAAIPSTVAAGRVAAAHVSPNWAGARPVQLTLTLRRELQCGRLRTRAVLVALPPAFSLPQRIASEAVRVGGKAAQSVSVSRETHRIRITLERPHGMTCYSIAPGTVTIAFAKTAHLGNPARPGHYRITVTTGRQQTVVSLAIR